MTSKRRLRLLVVEDSLTVRKTLVEELSADPELQVVGEAEDGRRGVELCKELRPDVVTMDMMMPGLTGLEATEQIMAYCPTPILIVSASLNRGEVFGTFDALAAGAVDVLDKPTADDVDGRWAEGLRAAVKMAARIRVIAHPRARLASRTAWTPRERSPSSSPPKRLVAIGGSTGGPAAVASILRGLPASFPLPILLVVHISPLFALPFSDWLDGLSPIPVRVAVDGEPLPRVGAPCVVVAPPDRHLVVERGRLRFRDTPERHACRPSVDELFESIAREIGAEAIACLLTGMGNDGAAGMLAIRRAGGETFAQDEASSTIYGMPREAVAMGAASRVLPLDRIAGALIERSRPEPPQGGMR